VLVEALPLTASGTIDRSALSVLDAPSSRAADHPIPRPNATATEAALARIWSDVIGAPAMTPGDSFLDLGGQSLMAMQIASRAFLAFGVELPVEAFFPNPTLRDMAASIDALRAVSDEAP
jgi:hypothetical protein